MPPLRHAEAYEQDRPGHWTEMTLGSRNTSFGFVLGDDVQKRAWPEWWNLRFDTESFFHSGRNMRRGDVRLHTEILFGK